LIGLNHSNKAWDTLGAMHEKKTEFMWHVERPTININKPFVSKCSHWLDVRSSSPRTQVFWCNNVPYFYIEKEEKNCVIRKLYENENIERKEVEVLKTRAPIPLKKQICPPVCASLC
jgi:hypothetical protein